MALKRLLLEWEGVSRLACLMQLSFNTANNQATNAGIEYDAAGNLVNDSTDLPPEKLESSKFVCPRAVEKTEASLPWKTLRVFNFPTAPTTLLSKHGQAALEWVAT